MAIHLLTPQAVDKMRMWTEKAVIRTLIGVLTFTVVVFLGLTYLLSSLNHTLTYPRITISDTYVTDPTRAIATFMISLGAYLLVLIVVARLLRIHPYVYRGIDMWLYFLIMFCLIVGFIGLMGVAAVPINLQRSLHLIAAIMMFGAIGLMLISFTLLDESINIASPTSVRQFRILISAVLIGAGIALAILADLTDAAAAILEICLILIALLYIITWTHESEFPIKSRTLPARLSILAAERSDPPL